MVKRHRKKPVEIEAVQWTGENISELAAFIGEDKAPTVAGRSFTIDTLEGPHIASLCDYIIKGVAGEF